MKLIKKLLMQITRILFLKIHTANVGGWPHFLLITNGVIAVNDYQKTNHMPI